MLHSAVLSTNVGSPDDNILNTDFLEKSRTAGVTNIASNLL